MTARRAPKAEWVPIETVAPLLRDRDLAWFDFHGAARPARARVWRRDDGGLTVRAIGTTPDGHRVSYTVKVRRG